MTQKTVSQPSLLRNASWVVVWDGECHTYRTDIDIRLKDGVITQIADAGAIRQEPGDAVLDARGHLILPGFVNIHSHPVTEPSMRGVREDHGTPEQWMTGLYERQQAFKATPEGCRAGQVLAYAEMLASGVTTVADLSMPIDGWLDTMRASGMRVYAAPGFVSARWGMASAANVTWNWDRAAGRAGFERAQKILSEIAGDQSGLLNGIVYPMQIDTVEEDLLRESFALAEASDRPFMSHMAQSVVEAREMIRRHGLTPVAWAAKMGVLAPRTSMGHCIFLDVHPDVRWATSRDLAVMGEHGMTVAHCPSPFARYGAVLDNFARYRAAGVNIGIGTDLAPHNMVEEVRLAIIAGRIISRDVRTVDTASAFHAATIGGANALGRDDLGRIAAGAKADLVLVDLHHPLMQPARDPLRSFIFHAADRAVRTVLVGGRVVWQDGKAIGLDVAGAAAAIGEAQVRMCRDVPSRDYAGRSAEAVAPLSLPMA